MSDDEPLHPGQLTWAALLGRWVEFARSAVALPEDPEGQRLRDSVSDIIMLQAVWFALHHLDELSDDEQALGVDRAEVLIDKHARQLEARWGDQPMPDTLRELIEDARRTLNLIKQGRDTSGDDDQSPS
jgi:hypothetical protein